MGFIESVYEKAKADRKRVAIPEGNDPVMMRAALRAGEEKIAEIVFVGDGEELRRISRENNLDISGYRICDTTDDSMRTDIVSKYRQLPGVVMGEKSLIKRSASPLYLALMLEAVGEVDATIAGLNATTGEVVMAGSAIVGLAPDTPGASALFIIELEEYDGEKGRLLFCSDGGINVDPDAERLAGIAISSCTSFKAMTGEIPRCAMLSYSTLGSGGTSPSQQKVADAVRIANEKRPDLFVDGEFQVDAAINRRVAAKKVKRNSDVAGRANILVYPEIAACNISTKMVQQLSNCNTYGPIIQGFRLPVCDCSRGDTEDRIIDNIACSSVLAAKR